MGRSLRLGFDPFAVAIAFDFAALPNHTENVRKKFRSTIYHRDGKFASHVYRCHWWFHLPYHSTKDDHLAYDSLLKCHITCSCRYTIGTIIDRVASVRCVNAVFVLDWRRYIV